MEIMMSNKWASRLLPLLKEHHLLLSTLLVANSLANESLPIFIKRMTGDWIALLISVILVVLFGEIVPSAIMTGKHQLKIASSIVPFIQFLESILYLICYPLSRLLDYVLGTESKRYHLEYIQQIIKVYQEKDIIKPEELQIIVQVMELRNKQAINYIKPIQNICYLLPDEPFCKRLINKLKIKEYSTIPILEDSIVYGTFKVKSLLTLDESHYGKLIKDIVHVHTPLLIQCDTSLLDLLLLFQKYRTTIAFVFDEMQLMGTVTLTELFNQILDGEYVDEDIHGTIRQDYTQSSMQTIN